MPRPTTSELRSLVAATKVATNLADDLLDEAKKLAITGLNSFDMSRNKRYAQLTDAERAALHVELEALGFTVEENRQNARYFWELKW